MFDTASHSTGKDFKVEAIWPHSQKSREQPSLSVPPICSCRQLTPERTKRSTPNEPTEYSTQRFSTYPYRPRIQIHLPSLQVVTEEQWWYHQPQRTRERQEGMELFVILCYRMIHISYLRTFCIVTSWNMYLLLLLSPRYWCFAPVLFGFTSTKHPTL